MPIIEPSPTDSPQLSQGDVLQGVNLYATESGWEDGGGKPAKSPHKYCLILSRPCAIGHKRRVIVAGIQKITDKPSKSVDSFRKVHAFLTDMRDGLGSPDVFYLGQLPNEEGRFCARLDALSCIEVPLEEQTALTFLQEKRVGTLNAEFLRDLHVRVFMAYASLGFSDESWLPDNDLNWLVQAGKREVSEVEVELNRAKEKKANQDAQGEQSSEGAIKRLEDKLIKLQDQIEPYVNEKSLRENDLPVDN